MTWTSAAAAAGSWLQRLGHPNQPTIVESDDKEWVVELNSVGVLTLWHRQSNTLSVIIRGYDGQLEPETFHFLGHKEERAEAKEPLPAEAIWEQRHRKMMGL
jgi:RNA-splicing ligase RtcB